MKFILSYKVQDRPEIPLTVSQKTDKGLERWLRAWLRAFAGFAEGLGLVASTYMDGSSQLQFHGTSYPLLVPLGTRHGTHAHICRQTITHIKMSLK